MLPDYVFGDGGGRCPSELKWWALTAQLLLFSYLRPPRASIEHSLQDNTSLTELQSKKQPATSSKQPARPRLRMCVNIHVKVIVLEWDSMIYFRIGKELMDGA